VVPSPEVQEWAANVLLETVGDRAIDNQIRVQNLPPELGVLREHVQQAAAIVNQLLEIEIATSYDPETQTVLVQTPQLTPEQLAQVTESFSQVQGVRSVVITTANVTELLSERIYFDLSDVAIASTDYQDIIAPLARQLKSDPQMGLTIIGHTDSRGEERYNESLARRRALAVQNALIAQGIAPERLFIRGDTNPPPQVQTDDPLSKSRCVRFERVELTQ
jgi:outer membrane protein OmpA-like peptidoglycan-associated protein